MKTNEFKLIKSKVLIKTGSFQYSDSNDSEEEHLPVLLKFNIDSQNTVIFTVLI